MFLRSWSQGLLHIFDGQDYLIFYRAEMRESKKPREEGQGRNEDKKVCGVNDSLIKRCGEEMRTWRCGRKMRDKRWRQREAGRDQYHWAPTGSLWGSGGTTLSDIGHQSVCKYWFAFLLISMFSRNDWDFPAAFKLQQHFGYMCDDKVMSDMDSNWLRLFNFELQLS